MEKILIYKNKIISFFQNESKSSSHWLKDNLKTLLIAGFIAISIRTIFFEPFYIPSGSMKDGLQTGDFVLVSKYSYGYSRHSFPFGLAPIKGRIAAKQPERGDVIVFKLPTDTSINYIKRLIGLPGDTIQVKEGVVFINDKPVPKKKIADYLDDEDGLMARYQETLPNGKTHTVLDATFYGEKDNTPRYIVPKKHYLFMGDNRDNSQDSRYMSAVGFVPEKNLVGKARRVIVSSKGSILKFWQWHRNIRGDRFFKKIH